MEMFNTLVEAVFISFLVGAILGGVVVAHFVVRSQSQERGTEEKLQPVKVRSDRNDG